MSSGDSGFASRCFGSGKCGNIWRKQGPAGVSSACGVRLREGKGQSVGLPFNLCHGAGRFSSRYGFCGKEPVDFPSSGRSVGCCRVDECTSDHRVGSARLSCAQSHFDESLARWRALGDRVAIARCLNNFANFVRASGIIRALGRCWKKPGGFLRNLGITAEPRGLSTSLATSRASRVKWLNARELYQNALWAFRAAHDRWGIARSLTDLAQIACRRARPRDCSRSLSRALAIFVKLGHKRGIARALEGFACSALAQRDPARALAITAARRASAPTDRERL